MTDLLGFLASFWTAWCLVSLALAETLSRSEFAFSHVATHIWPKCIFYSSVALPLGLAISGAFYFAHLALRLPLLVVNISEIGAGVGATLFWIKRRKFPQIEYSIQNVKAQPLEFSRFATKWKWAIGGLGFWSLIVVLCGVSTVPESGGDAWSIWNLHARFLFRGGASWNAFFTPVLSWSHPDYPLLLPLSVARGWSAFGHETAWVPILISVAFSVATVTLLTTSLLYLQRDFLSGFAAAAVLIGTPLFLLYSNMQCVDIPLGFFFLATLVCLTLGRASSTTKHRVGCFAIAGMMASLAAWTKNEGALFCFVAIVAIIVTGKRDEKRQNLRNLAFFAVGALPFLFLLWYFKHFFAPSSELLSGNTTLLAKITDFARIFQIARAFAIAIFSFDGWFFLPILVLGIYATLLKFERPANRNHVSLIFVVLISMMTGYFLTYLATPYQLSWHLRSSLDRLLLQLWPSFLFGFFLLVRAPEAAMHEKSSTRFQENVEEIAH